MPTRAGARSGSCEAVRVVALPHARARRTPQEFAAGHVPEAINIPLMLSTPAGAPV
jgi:hypothetical protein